MKPLKILPANEIVLKRRFPDVLRKINESTNLLRTPDSKRIRKANLWPPMGALSARTEKVTHKHS